MKPRLLDLFCGAGGAAMGYQRAGFYVVGVDMEPQPNYCGDDFCCSDALEALVDHAFVQSFHAIHASPPCQAYTTMNNRHGSGSPALIAATRELLERSGLPYVIENVPGAKAHMKDPARITGAVCGLKIHRPRLFETNWPLWVPYAPWREKAAAAVYGKQDGRRLWTRRDGSTLKVATLEEGSEAMGIDWMIWDELREAIPPAYTELIGHQLMAHIKVAA